jgi:hypothetical protein
LCGLTVRVDDLFFNQGFGLTRFSKPLPRAPLTRSFPVL